MGIVDDVRADAAHVDRVNLMQTQIPHHSIPALLDGLVTNTHVVSLNLSMGRLGVDEVRRLAKVIEANKSIKEINLHNCSINDAHIQVIAAAFKRNTTIVRLNLSGDPFSSDSESKMTSRGALSIAEMLDSNRTLRVLNISDHSIEDDGGRALVAAIARNGAVSEVDLQGNLISAEIQDRMRTACLANAQAQGPIWQIKPPGLGTTTAAAKLPHTNKPFSMPSTKAPRWTLDADAAECELCHARFTLAKRRHHCRRCGRCICGSCSPAGYKRPIPEFGFKDSVRHCKKCW